MSEKNDLFREFIEQLTLLDDLKDRDIENVDEALAKLIKTRYPKGFEFNFGRRNLMVKMLKKAAKMTSLIMTSKLRPYLDAIIAMRWQQFCDEVYKSGKKIDHYALLMKFARDVFVLGYALRSLEREIEKKESDNNKNAKDP